MNHVKIYHYINESDSILQTRSLCSHTKTKWRSCSKKDLWWLFFPHNLNLSCLNYRPFLYICLNHKEVSVSSRKCNVKFGSTGKIEFIIEHFLRTMWMWFLQNHIMLKYLSEGTVGTPQSMWVGGQTCQKCQMGYHLKYTITVQKFDWLLFCRRSSVTILSLICCLPHLFLLATTLKIAHCCAHDFVWRILPSTLKNWGISVIVFLACWGLSGLDCFCGRFAGFLLGVFLGAVVWGPVQDALGGL